MAGFMNSMAPFENGGEMRVDNTPDMQAYESADKAAPFTHL